MDVFQALIAKLVRCKSIERAIEPIASQVSLLIVILEQQNEEPESKETIVSTARDECLSVTACAQGIVEAVGRFISCGEKQGNAGRDKELSEQLASTYESLAVASDSLFIQAQRYDSKHLQQKKHGLCGAAKDVLQGVLKVLLVNDDHYVQHLLQKTDSVLNMIRQMENLTEMANLRTAFKTITYSVLAYKLELVHRCQDLRSKSCRDELMIWLDVLQKCVPSLNKACHTYLKYRTNLAAQTSRSSVIQEILGAGGMIKQLLQSGPQDEMEDRVVSFVAGVGKVIDCLSEINRGTLDPGTDAEILQLVHHSMTVSYCVQGVYKSMIVSSCHRILQSKFRLIELYTAMRHRPAVAQIRSDYENVCEIILDELCDLEKHVNMALMHLIVETFLCPHDRLATLKDIAGHRRSNGHGVDDQEKCVTELTELTETLCQVSLLVAASSTDTNKIREIVSSVRVLESIDLDIGPAVASANKDPRSQADKKYLNLVLERWGLEVGTIVDAVDSVVDPEVFLAVTESILNAHVEVFKDLRDGCPHSDVHQHFNRFLHLCQRSAMLVKKLIDDNNDSVYRNGLQYFINVLFQRLRDAKLVYREVMQTEKPPPTQYDTLERRMRLALEAVRGLREGLDARAHPHLLSNKRVMFQQPGSSVRQNKTSKKAESKVQTEQTQTSLKQINSQQEKKRSPFLRYKKSTSGPNKAIQQQPPSPPASDPAASEVTADDKHKEPEKPSPEPGLDLCQLFDKAELKGPSSEMCEVVQKLVTACSSLDHAMVQDVTHSLLSWSCHITENAKLLMEHHTHIHKFNELKKLVPQIEHATAEIAQKARFIMAGEKAALQELRIDAVHWARLMNATRVIIDGTVGNWLMLTRDICPALEAADEQRLKAQMNAVHVVQTQLCQLLATAQSLTGRFVENGAEMVEFLLESHNDIENLAFTIKTSVDVAAVSANRASSDWWQLVMACRDWSVAISCALSELGILSEKMEHVGQARLRGLQAKDVRRVSKIVAIYQEETNCLVELVDCVVVGDMTLKSKSADLLTQLDAAMSDMRTTTATQPSSDEELPFVRVRFDLARSRWIEKALEVQAMVQNNCFEYFGFVHQILTSAQEICHQNRNNDASNKTRQELGSQFLEKSQILKQHILRALELSPDLAGRNVVRACLGTLSKLTTQIEGMITGCPDLSDADVRSLSVQWAARVKRLVYSLKVMDGVQLSFITEIESLNKSSSLGIYQREVLPQQQHPHHHQQRRSYHEQPNSEQPHEHSEQQPCHHQQKQPHNEHPQQHQWVHNSQATTRHKLQEKHKAKCSQTQTTCQLSQPSVPSLSSLPQKIQSSEEFTPYGTNTHSRNTNEINVVNSPGDTSVQAVLKDAHLLDYRLKKWQDNETSISSSRGLRVTWSAMEMARLCSEMALFTTGQGSLKSSDEVIAGAVEIVRHGQLLERFARRLLSLTGNSSGRLSLEACTNRINTCASQLHIIATALNNSSRSFQGDRILVKNAQNLLTAVRQMFSVVETLAVKSLQEWPVQAEDETTKEVMSLLSRIQLETGRYIKDERNLTHVDELGLRRMEAHNPPTLTSFVDLKTSDQSFGRDQIQDH